MTDPAVSIGAIRLHDRVLPTLAAGVYRFRSGVSVRDVSRNAALEPPPEGVGVIDVDAPRFSVSSGDVVSQHPPRAGRGQFGDRLPHVALTRRTLPWERTSSDSTPWLALFVVREDEAELAPSKLRAGLGAGVVAAMDAVDPIDGDPDVVLLKVHDLSVFRAILPSRADVQLLAHVRQVNLADSALAGQDDDGWFAVVTANRLPVPGPEPIPYRACLVSLEARDDVWTAPGPQVPPLIVLMSWSFSSGGLGGTFEHLTATLDLAPFGTTAAGTAPLLDPRGSVPLERTLRDGSTDAASYRSPLLGIAPDAAPVGSADVTLAAAGELGLLTAGADGRFLRQVVAWHLTAEAKARSGLAQVELTTALDDLAGPAAMARSRITEDPVAPGTALTEGVLDVLRQSHSRPADLWQAHPVGLSIAAARAGLRDAAALRSVAPGAVTDEDGSA